MRILIIEDEKEVASFVQRARVRARLRRQSDNKTPQLSAGDLVMDIASHEVYIRHLRQKIEQSSGQRLIHTVRNSGYVIREPET
jgi:DNA-binding response OmpR family regulator